MNLIAIPLADSAGSSGQEWLAGAHHACGASGVKQVAKDRARPLLWRRVWPLARRRRAASERH